MCQHGHGECVGNAVQMCVIEQTKSDPAKYMPFIKWYVDYRLLMDWWMLLLDV